MVKLRDAAHEVLGVRRVVFVLFQVDVVVDEETEVGKAQSANGVDYFRLICIPGSYRQYHSRE